MAERRMFSKSVIDSGRFLRLSARARLLYYDLGMAADDDGAVEALGVMRKTDARPSVLNELVEAGYIVVLNEDMAVWIRDWKKNNYLQRDRCRSGPYHDVIESLKANEDNACANSHVYRPYTQDSTGKDSIAQESTAQDNTAQESTAQTSTDEHSLFCAVLRKEPPVYTSGDPTEPAQEAQPAQGEKKTESSCEAAQDCGGGAYPALEVAQPAQGERDDGSSLNEAQSCQDEACLTFVSARPAQGERDGKRKQGEPHGRCPTLEEVRAYTVMRGSPVDADTYYEVRSRAGWRDKKGEPIRDWRADIRSWERYQRESPGPPAPPGPPGPPAPPALQRKSRNSMVQSSSFDAEEFFAAAVRRSYEDWPDDG